MKLIHTVEELRSELSVSKSAEKKVGFVPTMGALHPGHLALVKRCVEENEVTVVNIFVNPTQFNDKNDLENYPRTLEADLELLKPLGVDLVFNPSVEEIYPEPDTRVFDLSPLDSVMEGYYRPGHFNGVCQVVSKLFDRVRPDRAYFGEKDFQQLAVIRAMVSRLNYLIDIIGCPIVRESDGLAMSSRNQRLSAKDREIALKISHTLFKSCTFAESNGVAETMNFVERSIVSQPGLTLEYFSIVDGDTLQPVKSWEEASRIIGCIAVFCGGVRLIDNIKYKEE
ncbi:MAG: pantoate--beta-alanine ligase [Bacteroides sp.]|nr:pantoate--beta-alanine ligase [Bacteroides sp.]